MKKFVAIAALAAFATPAAAGNLLVQPRAEVAYSYLDFEEGTFNAFGARAGLDFAKFFGVEGEVFFGVGEDEVGGVDIELNNKFGGYGVLRIPDSIPGVTPFVRAGVVNAELEASAGPFSGSESDTGYAFGGGLSGGLVGTPFGWRVDYTRLEFDDVDANEFSAALVYKF